MPLYALSDEFRSEFNFKCIDSIIPAQQSGDTVVPSFTGEEDKTEALRWLILFTQWALQQGLSADHTLLLASTHINYSLIYQPQLPTWTEFIHDFFTYYDAAPGQGQLISSLSSTRSSRSIYAHRRPFPVSISWSAIEKPISVMRLGTSLRPLRSSIATLAF